MNEYPEIQPSSDFISQHFCDDTVKGGEDLHRKLRLDAALIDQVIESIGERQADAGLREQH